MPKKSTPAEPSSSSQLTITAQQSRFHTDAVDAPASKEIWVKDLSIAIGQRQILDRAELHFKERKHYVLVGRNGTGKSTILKTIHEGRIPGIPWSTRILLLGQTRELTPEEAIGGLSISDVTVLEHVVRSDRVREGLMKEAQVLSAGLDAEADPLAAVRAYRQISYQRLELRLEETRQIALRRSGARGAKARKLLIETEEEFEVSKARLQTDLSTLDSSTISDETRAAVDLLTGVQSNLELMNADAATATARTVLLGLGFSAERIEGSLSKLSGGWRTRCNLACALCQSADVLFLDEPTNFLDLPSILWLQKYIQSLEDTTVVCVSHDRDFADAVAEELIVLRDEKLEYFKGNLSLYESERIKKAKWLADMNETNEKQKAHFQQSINNQNQAARKAGDDKKLKQAASRQKRLDERMGMQVNAKGHRFKLNRDMGGYHLSSRAGIEVPDFDPPVKIRIPSNPPDLRFPGALSSLDHISFGYPAGKGKRGPEILKDITMTIHPSERIGLCGLNGSGKTTLVSILMGLAEEPSSEGLTPTQGVATKHSRAKFARFSQQVVEELEVFGAQNRDVSALRHLMDVAGAELPEKEARAILGGLGLQGAVASDVPIFALSGGQKVRLALAKIVWSPPHLLILDEVTTHLDSDTISGLTYALRGYGGALLVVTHDRFFCRCVVEGQSPARLRRRPGIDDDDPEEESEDDSEDGVTKKGTVFRLFRGQLKVLEDGMDQYEAICDRASAKLTKARAA